MILCFALSLLAGATSPARDAATTPASMPQGFIDADEPSSAPVAAQEEDADESPLPSKAVAQRPWYEGLGLGGFLDAGFGIILPGKDNTFFVGEVEVDLKKKLFDVAALRIDVNLQNRLPWQPAGAQPGYSFANFGLAFDNLLEQGYAEWFPLGEAGPRLRLGKYNANVAFERLDPNERFMVSQSLVFLHGSPGNFTGLALEIPLPVSLHLTLHGAVNGWDRGLATSRNKTVGARLTFDRVFRRHIRLLLSFATIFGTERFANESDYRLTLFGVAGLELLNSFLFAAETTWGREPGIARGTIPGYADGTGTIGVSSWFGLSAWMRFVVPKLDWLSFTARYDFFDDPARTRGLVQTPNDLLEGGLTRRQQASISVAARIVEGARARLEYTADFIEGREPDKVRALAVAHRIVLQALYEF